MRFSVLLDEVIWFPSTFFILKYLFAFYCFLFAEVHLENPLHVWTYAFVWRCASMHAQDFIMSITSAQRFDIACISYRYNSTTLHQVIVHVLLFFYLSFVLDRNIFLIIVTKNFERIDIKIARKNVLLDLWSLVEIWRLAELILWWLVRSDYLIF